MAHCFRVPEDALKKKCKDNTRREVHCYTRCCIPLVYTAPTSTISRIVVLSFYGLPVAALFIAYILCPDEDSFGRRIMTLVTYENGLYMNHM
jgi:hypothetical protein